MKKIGQISGALFGTLAPLIPIVFAVGCTGGGGGGVSISKDSQGEDPVVLEIPIAYIKRPLPEEPTDLRNPLEFAPGAQLFVRDRSAASADETDITRLIAQVVAEEEGIAAEEIAIDIKGVDSSFDGSTLIFAVRAVPQPIDDNLERTTWNLWTLNLESLEPQYLIPSRIKRNEGVETGGGHDIAPHFLTDDRILFSSTRQVASQARQLDESRSQIFAALTESGNDPAAVLHIYDPQLRDAEFKQISFNLSHDLDAAVLSSGEIVFSRWNNTASNHISLFRVSPSGLELSPLYGFHSQNTGTNDSAIEFMAPRELDDGRLISVAKPFSSTTFGGELIIIDTENFTERDQPTWENQGAAGPGHVSLTNTEIRTDGLLSQGGQFGSVYPLRDGTGRLLVTWADCRVIAEDANLTDPDQAAQAGDFQPCKLQADNTVVAPPLYGAWIYDPANDTQLPVVVGQEGFIITEVIAAEPREFPEILPLPLSFNADLAAANMGQLLIDSVYDLDGMDNSPAGIAQHAQPGNPAFAARPARFLRIFQPVPIPDPDVFEIPEFAFGVTTAFSFREITGYAPIEPDGSVTVNVSADRPFSFSVLDVQGRRIGPRHNYWLQLGPGEVMHCTGCHSGGNPLPHGRYNSQPTASNPGATALPNGVTGFSGTDSTDLFATEVGQTMAQVWDFHRPMGNETAPDRQLTLAPSYTDEWSAPTLTRDPDILDREYDPDWTDIPADKPIIVNNLDPGEPSRIVINYIDHIQPIWQRVRSAVDDGSGNMIDTCVGCHATAGDTSVAAGQLDLTNSPSAIDPDHYRSYRELLDIDSAQWITTAGALAERQRVCSEVDEQGNILSTTLTLSVGTRMRAGFANQSDGFLNCFEGGACGPDAVPALPDNCTEDGGIPVPATTNTVDHRGLLSASELRLISEWLDIGAQYYNNPFDARLIE
ncbi:MAG: hypothetical protein V7709_01120 [Halioglobus sp.]